MEPRVLISFASLFCRVHAAEVLMTLMGDQCFTSKSSAIAPIYNLSDDAWSEYNGSAKIRNEGMNYVWQPTKLCPDNNKGWNGWTKRNSLQFDDRIDNLITDRRWEEFPTYFTKHIDEDGQHDIRMANLPAEKFMVSISLQIDHGAYLILCSVDTSHCQWIMIDAKKSAKPEQFQAGYKNKDKKLTEGSSRWHHYKIIKNRNELTLLTEKGETFMHQTLNGEWDKIPFVSLYAHSTHVNGLWKLHLFDYYYTSKLRRSSFTFKLDAVTDHQCVSMFVTMCSGCQLRVQFYIYIQSVDNWDERQENIKFDKEKNHWRENKWCFNVSRHLNLQITTLNPDSLANPYWAFHDIQMSSSNESVRILKPPLKRWTGECQHLNTESVINNNTESTASLENWQQCNEYQFGEDCTPCNITHSTDLCKKFRKYCQLFRSGPKDPIQSNCYCSIGYEGSMCQNPCSYSFFGHSCKKSCSNCQEGCSDDTIHGKCSSEHCTDNFTGEKCDIPYGIFIFTNGPEMQVGVESCNLTLNSFQGIGNVTAMTKYVFQYRKEGTQIWINFPYNFLDFGKTEKVELKVLSRNTDYELRVLGFVNNEDLDTISKSGNHLAQKLSIYNFKTMCKVIGIDDLSYKSTKNSMEICIDSNKASYDACALKNYDIELNGTIKMKRIKNCFAAYDLEPFTQYSIQVIMDKKPLIKTSFHTLESVPSKVRDFIFTDRTSSSIFVKWQKPQMPNGVLLYYRIVATLERLRACPERLIEPTAIHFDVESHQIAANLTGLRPYSLYKISIAANTSEGFGDSEHLPDVETRGIDQIQDEELPQLNHTIPGVTSVSFQFSNTSCRLRMGFLNIRIDVWGPECVQQSSLLYNISELVEVVHLTPFCNYQARFQLSRRNNGSNREFMEQVKFATLQGVPNVIRNLLVTSKGPDHIALRWLPPHPPTGSLEHYLITVFYYGNDSNVYSQNFSFSVKTCELWPELEYHCATMRKNIKENCSYVLEVRAKNEGNDGYSKSTNITAQAMETQPGKPRNFDYLWTAENYLNLTWHHPNETNGLLKSFDIYIHKIKFPPYIIHSENDYRSKYSTQITNTTLLLAKQFYVLVSARNSNGNSDNGEWLIMSPPPIPQNTIEGTCRESSFIEVVFKQIAYQSNFARFTYLFVSEYGNSDLAEVIARLENHYRSSSQSLQVHSIGDWTLIYHSQLTKHFIENLTISNTSAEANYTIEPTGEYTLAFAWVHKYFNYTRSNYTIKAIAAHFPSRLGTRIMLPLAVTVLIVITISGAFLARRFKFRLQQIIRDLLAPVHPHDGAVVASSDLQPSEHTYVNKQDVLLHELKWRESCIATVRPLSELDPAVEICPGVPPFKTVHSMRINLEDFHNYVKRTITSGELAYQHQLFPMGMVKDCTYGSLPENKVKNRYQYWTAYDHSRVVLNKVNGDEFSDYINANFVDGYRHPKAYIATQGPKKNTVADFWRMVWQEKVSHIVMVANVIEGNKKKTEQYWPDVNREEIFGDYRVTHVSSEAFANYECRRLVLQYMFSKFRKITHLHFKMWPDHGVPLYPQSLVPFVERLLSLRPTDFPLVVHCSAGMGRTGTLILCDISLRMAAYEGHIDLLSMLEHIRNQRPNMVDNIEQYKLAHLVVLNCLMGLSTGVKINDNFQEALKGLQDLDLQLKYIRDCEWQDEAMRNMAGLEQLPLIVKEKNRFSNIAPDPVARGYLHEASSASSTYINAVQVDGFYHLKKFIVTQYPLPNARADFWRMVTEQEISVVIYLNELPLPSSKKFWPDKPTRQVDVVKVTHVRTESLSVCKVFTLEIRTSYENQQDQIWTATLLSFIGWKYPAPTPNHSDFITFVEDVALFSKNASRILVSCCDGATASGLFVALSFLLEKVKLEQEVDVCQAVRSIRTSRKEFVNTKEQLEFLYKAMVLHVEKCFMSYANISSTTSK